MKRIILFLASVLVMSCVHAEKYSFTVPEKNMVLSFDAPGLSSFEGRSNKEQMQFKAQGFEGFNLSYFVEPSEGKGSNAKECFEFYWKRAQTNPMMDKATIKLRESGNMSVAEYDLAGEWQGKNFRMPNRNFYLYVKGNCIDIHISKLPFTESDLKMFRNFEDSIKFE